MKNAREAITNGETADNAGLDKSGRTNSLIDRWKDWQEEDMAKSEVVKNS